MDLSVVDLQAPLADQVQTMASACESIGFFRIPLSSIDRAVADNAWNDAQKFFALPEADKTDISFPRAGYPYGYSPFGFETLAKSVDPSLPGTPDMKESLSVGPDCGLRGNQVAHPESEWIRSPSLWPSSLPELRSSWTAYYRALAGVCEHLMSVMAIALDLPADYFAPVIDNPISSMRALHYPAIAVDAAPSGALRAGAHSDYGTLTILRTDEVPGLEIEAADGTWLEVEPMADMFLVNLGDSIAQWTNDRWRSTVHRVNTTDTRARQSFAFFHMANWDAIIDCLPTCLDPGESPRQAPVQAGPWLLEKFQATVTT